MSKKSAVQTLNPVITSLEHVTRDVTGIKVNFDGVHERTNTAIGAPKGTPKPEQTKDMTGKKSAELTAEQLVIRQHVNGYWQQFARIAREMTLQALSVCKDDNERAIVFDTSLRSFADIFKANKVIFGIAPEKAVKDETRLWETRCKDFGLNVTPENIERTKAEFARIRASMTTTAPK